MKRITKAEIERLYHDYVLVNDNPGYLNRYVNLPHQLNNKNWKWEDKGFPRIIALLEFDGMVQRYHLRAKNLLTFNSPNDPELEYLPHDNHFNFNYVDDPINLDLHDLHIPYRDYDFVMLNQTLEHLYNPFICLENTYQYMAKGAYFYANVPSMDIAHDTPYHYYTGFTPTGLACLFKTCGFEIIEIGQWGNVEYINLLYKTQGWPDYRALKSYHNNFNTPIILWTLAKKA